MDFMGNNSILMGSRALDFLWEKQKVVMHNIANNETPGFKAKYVTFEEELQNRLSGVNDDSRSHFREEIKNTKIRINNTNEESNRMDGNNVNTDAESAELARTTIQYQFMLNSVNSDFSRLRTAIKGQ